MEASSTSQTPTTALNFGDIGNSLVNRTLVTITCFLSLLGALLIIVTYIFWKDMRSCSRKILVYISISDSVVAASYMFGVLLPENANSTACVTQSFLSTAANICSFFWTLFMAIYLYAAVARQTPAYNFLWFFHVIAWGVPLFIVVLAWERGALGNDRDIYSSGWCWIRVRDHGNDDVIWMFVTDKFWEILVFVLILIFYGLLKCHIRTEVNNKPIDRTYVIVIKCIRGDCFDTELLMPSRTKLLEFLSDSFLIDHFSPEISIPILLPVYLKSLLISNLRIWCQIRPYLSGDVLLPSHHPSS